MVFEIDEGTRQAIILALAHFSIERPGWEDLLSRIAKDFGDIDLKMFESFKKIEEKDGGKQ